jgi:hypothetical protein
MIGMMTLALALPLDVPTQLSDRALLDQARSAFLRGRNFPDQSPQARAAFAEAGRNYEVLRQRGYQSANLLCSQGNAYLLAGDLPAAILTFHRGLMLAPDNARLRWNLGWARKQVAYRASDPLGKPNPSDGWLRAPPNVVGILAFLFYLLACLGLTHWWVSRQPWLFGVSAVAMAGAVLMAISLDFEFWQRRREMAAPLVLIAKDRVTLHGGDGYSYPVRYATPVYRGVEARRLFERNGWLQIELAGGEVGWVPKDAALVDAP